MSCACVALIVLPTVFSMTWYEIVMQHFLVGMHSPKVLCVYQENTSDSWDIPWYTNQKCCITSIYISKHVSKAVHYV